MNTIPNDWRKLRVADFVKVGNFPSNLSIYWRGGKSKKIYSHYLPDVDEDPRPHQGRCKEGKGKRLYRESSMGTDNPREAMTNAITWAKKDFKELQGEWTDTQMKREYSLHKYWENWSFREFEKPRRNLQAERKFKRDTQLKWDADDWGVRHQPWSLKSVDEITFADFQDYFSLLEKRARKKGTNGSGMKEQQKTFIRSLMKAARIDFPHLQIPEFPAASRQTKQVIHLNHQQWDLLLRTIKEACDFAVNKELTEKDYKSLEWTQFNRENQRNWVDLYDALLLEWFFHLRSEDMYRLKSEWFHDAGDGEYECKLEETKGNRPIHITRSFRPDADRFMARMKLRRPKKGYLIFPEMPRPEEGGAENKVRNTLNFLLKKAVAKCLPDFDLGLKPWTTIRHTAFRLMLEDDPSLWVGHKLRDFAINGHTSPDQLQTTYITPIQSEKTAKETRETIRSKGWSTKGRVKV